MKISEIRKKFAEYFEKHGHDKKASSSLIPENDPTLLFANAGMNQFKDYFTGKANAKNPRAVSIQKCVRAGGKHNDLENVGLTARHHTFFEMLGNFSFGDYFKEEAIRFAWDFLTKELKIPTSKLYVTVHHTDDEALKIWNEKIGVPKEKIFKKGDKDNFWEMGEFGPCGPCSEIFYDHGEEYKDPNVDPQTATDILDDEMRYVEIWNLVFMQFEKTPEGKFNLPKPSIDTGAGLERLAACLQGVYWNYDTDAFTPIISKLESFSGKKYNDENYTSSFRIVADHIRAATMLITDGVIPSNEGRGYVLRRIIRRAIRHIRKLDAPNMSFSKLIPTVFEILGDEYPQNKNNIALATKLLELEEKKFLETLDKGLKFLNEATKANVKNSIFPGSMAFKLYDTYGFPLDLTQIILQEQNIQVDIKEFNSEMKKRKEESKKSWKGGSAVDNKLFFEIKEKHGETQFTGYSTLKQEATLLEKTPVGEYSALIFDKTSFYGESGGQAGDTGYVISDGNIISQIDDTQKPVENLFVHFSKNADALEIGQKYTLHVDTIKRKLTARNHSATHLLQSALIETLGDHIKQAGSQVDSKRLRFDFTHPQAVSKKELKAVEQLVNKKIEEALNVEANLMTKDQAVSKGALALFGEKYGDEVRVLEMGNFSTELCGGTHVSNTNEIELFTIISEGSLSTGVRRIEALTSSNAITRLKNRSDILEILEQQTNANASLITDRIENMSKEIKSKQKEIERLQEKLQNLESKDLFNNTEKLNSTTNLTIVNAPEDSDLRKLSDIFINDFPNNIGILYKLEDGKTNVLIRAPKKLKSVHCGNILKESLKELDGRGGGRPDMAQGSGPNNNIEKFLETAKKLITESI